MRAVQWVPSRRKALYLAGITGSLFLMAIGAAQIGLPAIGEFESTKLSVSPSDLVVLDSKSMPLQGRRVSFNKRQFPWVPLTDFSEELKQAIVAAEDKSFWQHDGWTLSGLLRAVGNGGASGGSTISMQTANLAFPAIKRSRPWLYKLRQILLAKELEKHWSKAQILEAYLNLVPLKGELVGVPAASWLWFKKYPKSLLQSEAAAIAAILPAPNALQSRVQKRLYQLAQCNEKCDLPEQALQAVFKQPGGDYAANEAPHFALAVSPEDQVQHAPIRSTIDGDLQRFVAESAVAQRVALEGQNVHDIAALVVENSTGRVVAYLGNQGRLSSARHIDGVKALRQAGSTLKPFLYGLAIENRHITAATRIVDDPLDVVLPSGTYAPQNYDRQFHGAASVRLALANSLNVPAVNVLKLIGTEQFMGGLLRFGFKHLREADHYGLSLALGSGQVSLEELVAAYRTIAQRGVYTPLCKTEPCLETAPQQAMLPGAAFIISDILSDNAARSEVFGSSSPLHQSFWSSAKTGTSRDMRDNWCIGFSREYTVGVWVGNFDNDPMWDVSGVTGAAPLWGTILSWLHENRATVPWVEPEMPDEVRQEKSGSTEGEYYLSGTEPQKTISSPSAIEAKIIYPSAGVQIATDTGIPLHSQKIMIETQGGKGANLFLDGAFHAAAEDGVLWSPTPGRHQLSLVGEEGKVLDRVVFMVRG
jgi:penicillin-binding protein 1C